MTGDTRAAARVAAAPAADGAQPRTAPTPTFEWFAQLAAGLCQTPFASLMLVDGDYACAGPGADRLRAALATQDPFSAPTARASQILEVPDLRLDERFRAEDCAFGALTLRFYAGCALRTSTGELLGTLAVYHTTPRRLTARQRAGLLQLAEQCAAHAELRARLAELECIAAAPIGPAPIGSASRCATPEQSAAAAEFDAFLAHELIESAPVAIYHADTASEQGYVNPEYRRIFGLSAHQSDADWAQSVHPEDRDRIKEIWVQFRRQPRPMRFEYRLLSGDGEVRYVAEQVVPTAGHTGYVGSIAEFTELVTARGDLHRAETLFRNTFDQAPIGVAYADRAGRLQRFNASFSSLLGYAASELEGKSIGELTHAEDAPHAAAELERLWNGEVQFIDIEKRYLRRDGSEQWVRSSTALVRDAGATQCSVEYLRDISQRKQLAADLLEQQTLLEVVISELPVALLVCDARGDITHSNLAAADLFRIPLQCSSAEHASDPYQLAIDVYLMDGVTRIERADRPLARALRGETISNLELIVAPRDSTPPRTTLSNVRRLLGPDGQTLGAVAIIQDTTELKARELQLERAQKELMTASRQAGMAEVATNVLHNVGNILNSINVSASLVADRVRQSKADGVARIAALLKEQGAAVGKFIGEDERGKRVPDYLAALGEQLLADQRAALQELGSLRENLEHIKDTVAMQQSYAKRCGVTETVAVAELVEDSLRLNAGAFARHGVTLQRDFKDVPSITTDKHKVLQILVNLMRNAKYACDDSGSTDKLITLRIEGSTLGVRISVIDNGIGISAENLAKLFTHGFTTRRSGHGFGLHSGALAAQELGGTLRAESAGPGCGATFTLDLPCVPPAGS